MQVVGQIASIHSSSSGGGRMETRESPRTAVIGRDYQGGDAGRGPDSVDSQFFKRGGRMETRESPRTAVIGRDYQGGIAGRGPDSVDSQFFKRRRANGNTRIATRATRAVCAAHTARP